MQFLSRLASGGLGGFIGGAIVGTLEAAVVAFAGGEEYWGFLFGAVSYGILGGCAGIGWGVFEIVLPGEKSGERTLTMAAGLAGAGLMFIVSRFRVARDVFAESLPTASLTGIAVHIGLLVLAFAVFLVLRRVLSGMAARRGSLGAGLYGAVGVVGIAVVAAITINFLAGGPSRQGLLPPATASGPNVILVIADTLRADKLGAYGAGLATPALDALAADGIVYDNAFTQSSWTRPSIATILTSLYPSSHGVMHKTDLLPDEVTSLAEAMKGAGYRTAGFVTNINVAPSFNFQQGFDTYAYLSPDFFFGASDSGSKLSLYSGMRLVRERFLSKRKFVHHYYQDAETVNDMAVPWLESNSREPFFALIHYMDPHDPYFVMPYDGKAVARVDTPHPDPSRAAEIEELYDSNVEYLDGFIAALVAQLKEAGIYDDTVIAFTSDHGEEFYEHGGWWHGTTLYEEQLHVPLIVKLDSSKHSGTHVRDLAGTIDIAPTLMAAAGLELPASFQGRDLLGPSKAPNAMYAEEDHEGNIVESVRTMGWKLIVANEGNPRGLATVELYDMSSDPGETKNLASQEPDRVASLKAEMAALRQFAGSRAVGSVTGEIDEAAEERLRALGYIQ